MKVIKNGDIVFMYGGEAQVLDKIPNDFYNVVFSQNQGFMLQRVDVKPITEKIYGSSKKKVRKVINRYKTMNRNFGVILSGVKGMGKTCFAKLLASEVVLEMPVIFVNSNIGGIASFIESIDQEIMVLFDEFDKNFAFKDTQNGEYDPQEQLLTLFDGILGGKKLFTIICNNQHALNQFLIDRPARFHYHFKFQKPDIEDIDEYLKDNLTETEEFKLIKSFIVRSEMNYDSMRALISEINIGSTLSEAITDMNISIPHENREYSGSVDVNGTARYFSIGIDLMSIDKNRDTSASIYGDKTFRYIFFNYKDMILSEDNEKIEISKYSLKDYNTEIVQTFNKRIVLKRELDIKTLEHLMDTNKPFKSEIF